MGWPSINEQVRDDRRGNSQYSDQSPNAINALGESTAKRYSMSGARESSEWTNLLGILGKSGDHVGKDGKKII